MSDIITTLKAINNPVRLDILRWLKEPKVNFEVADQLVDADEVGVCVSIIQEKAGLSQSTVSAYLATPPASWTRGLKPSWPVDVLQTQSRTCGATARRVEVSTLRRGE